LPLSQGLKAGLAAGVVYGALVGVLHIGTLEACSASQISYISQQLLKLNAPSNETATQMFGTEVLYFPMIYGIWGLIYGVLYGALYASLYTRLPGSNSKMKGLSLAIPVFLIGVFAGPMDYLAYHCSPGYVPIVSVLIGVPVCFVFGYFLGLFYDSFGRLALEEKEQQKTDAARRPKTLIFDGQQWTSRFRTRVWPSQRVREAHSSKWKLIHWRPSLSLLSEVLLQILLRSKRHVFLS